jgi:hypothetical protein
MLQAHRLDRGMPEYQLDRSEPRQQTYSQIRMGKKTFYCDSSPWREPCLSALGFAPQNPAYVRQLLIRSMASGVAPGMTFPKSCRRVMGNERCTSARYLHQYR